LALLSFGVPDDDLSTIQPTGMAGAYLLERSQRLLFLSERDVRREHTRAEYERSRTLGQRATLRLPVRRQSNASASIFSIGIG
jgi:hypothetical protein